MTTTPMQTKDTVRNGVNVTQLGQTIHAIRHNPDIAQFKFRARNQWDTGGHNQATVHTFYGACQEMEHKQTFQFKADLQYWATTRYRRAPGPRIRIHSRAAS